MKISVFPAAEKDSAAFQNFGEGTPAKYVFPSVYGRASQRHAQSLNKLGMKLEFFHFVNCFRYR
jgi:hypothetical protein